MTNPYSDSPYPIREALAASHAETLASFSKPGRWFTARQRRAIVAEARSARAAQNLYEDTPENGANDADALSKSIKKIVRQAAIRTNDLDRSFFEQALADGVSDTEYVEIIGVVARSLSVDVFARGMGLSLRELPAPEPEDRDGEPNQHRPTTAIDEKAWVNTVPGGRRGGDDAIFIYGSNRVEVAAFIYKALSLVPEEAKGLVSLGGAQYMGFTNFLDFGYSNNPKLSRAQMEVIAGRVSAINQCFY